MSQQDGYRLSMAQYAKQIQKYNDIMAKTKG